MAPSARETLRIGYGLLPIVAGADKFTNLLVDWEKYLARDFERKSPVSGRAFMRFVGVVEMAAGALVLSRWTRLGAWVVAGGLSQQGRRELRSTPHLPHGLEKGARLEGAVEIEVDDHVPGIVHGPRYPVAAHAGMFPASGVTVERRLPGLEVTNGMLDLHGEHGALYLVCPRPAGRQSQGQEGREGAQVAGLCSREDPERLCELRARIEQGWRERERGAQTRVRRHRCGEGEAG